VELVGSWSLESGKPEHALWLELSRPLNRLGHVIAAFGVRRPLGSRSELWSVEAYLLWDFGDGPFWAGW
jgi:hypothetical protein